MKYIIGLTPGKKKARKDYVNRIGTHYHSVLFILKHYQDKQK